MMAQGRLLQHETSFFLRIYRVLGQDPQKIWSITKMQRRVGKSSDKPVVKIVLENMVEMGLAEKVKYKTYEASPNTYYGYRSLRKEPIKEIADLTLLMPFKRYCRRCEKTFSPDGRYSRYCWPCKRKAFLAAMDRKRSKK